MEHLKACTGIFLLLLVARAPGSQGASMLSAGETHTCLLDTACSPPVYKCWGANLYGQLGLNDVENRGDDANEMGASLPMVNLRVTSEITTLSTGTGAQHSCAVFSDGSLRCFGRNNAGQLGLGDLINRGTATAPIGVGYPAVDLGTGNKASAVAAGSAHTCALLESGGIKCFGSNSGQLGYGDLTMRGDGSASGAMGDSLPAVALGAGKIAVAVDVGNYHSCALLSSNEVKCWGINDDGQLGYGDTALRGNQDGEMGDTLPALDLGASAKAISCGGRHTCAILLSGAVKCWGNNGQGQLGLGDTTDRGTTGSQMGSDLPEVNLGTGRSAVAISAGEDHTCVILDNDDVKCWGEAFYGQLGLGDKNDRGDDSSDMGSLPPIDLGVTAKPISVAAGDFHTCVLFDSGETKCFGDAFYGAIGYPYTTYAGDETGEMGSNLPATETGTCQHCTSCSGAEFDSNACSTTATESCQACSSANTCSTGEYQLGCGLGFEGWCMSCSDPWCPDGQFLEGCSGGPGRCSQCTVCGASEFKTTNCSLTEDTGCSECSTLSCVTEHYRSGCGNGQEGTCTQCQACSTVEYEISGCMQQSDRDCGNCSSLSCPADHFRENCGSGSTGTCQSCSTCGAMQFISQDCSTQADLVCSECSSLSCPAGHYRAGCGNGAVGSCVPFQNCSDSQFVAVEGSAMADRVCQTCATCYGSSYLVSECSPSANTVCALCSTLTCAAGSFRVGCGNSNQGTCTPCASITCSASQFEESCSVGVDTSCQECSSLACGEEEFRVDCGLGQKGSCTACAQCSSTEFAQTDCMSESDRICADCSTKTCPTGTFLNGCGLGLEGQCQSCAVCGEGEFQVTSCSGSSDTICQSCETCETGHFRKGCLGEEAGSCEMCLAECTELQYETVACNGTQDRVCQDCSQVLCPGNQVLVGCGNGTPGECQDPPAADGDTSPGSGGMDPMTIGFVAGAGGTMLMAVAFIAFHIQHRKMHKHAAINPTPSGFKGVTSETQSVQPNTMEANMLSNSSTEPDERIMHEKVPEAGSNTPKSIMQMFTPKGSQSSIKMLGDSFNKLAHREKTSSLRGTVANVQYNKLEEGPNSFEEERPGTGASATLDELIHEIDTSRTGGTDKTGPRVSENV